MINIRLLEVCPLCGKSIIGLEKPTKPPTPVKKCNYCNWKWEGEPEEVLKVPFNPNGYGKMEFEVPDGTYELTMPVMVKVQVNL